MKASTKTLALRAAAKAALSVSLAGCGGATLAHAADEATRDASPGPEDEGKDAMARDADLLLADAHDGAMTASEPCPGVSALADAAVSKGSFTCCVSYLSPAGDAAFGSLATDAAAPASRACCDVVIRYVDQDPSETAYATAEALLPACCDARNPEPEGRACTPWGPPVPPSMPSLPWGVA
jgi:hypothetical protein